MLRSTIVFLTLVFLASPVFPEIHQTNPDSIPFAPPVNYAVGKGPYYADLDGNLDLDLAVANHSSSNISKLMNLTLPSDLIGYWKFDEGTGDIAYDASGYGNDGTLIYNPTWSDGISGGALDFDGVDDHVAVSKNAVVGLTHGTVSAWVYPNELTSDNWFFAYAMDSYKGVALCADYSGRVCGQLNQGSGDVIRGNTPGLVKVGEWNYLTMTWNSSQAKLYVNGIPDKEVANSGYPQDYNSSLLFGADSFVRDYFSFNGKIDEVKIYSRALSSEEICKEFDLLVGYWKFDEGTGDIAYDSSGYGNNGILNGPTWVNSLSLLNKALDFDGIDDNVVVPDAPSLDLSNALTITMWIKPDSNIYPGFPDYYNLLSKWHGKDDQARTGYLLSLNTYATGQLRLALGFENYEWSFTPSEKDTWNGGQWYHVAATYDATLPSGNIKYYVDGVLDSQYDENRMIAPNTLSLYINIDPFELWHAGNTYFPGLIDQVKLCKRGLSEEEIREEFESGFIRGDATADGLVNLGDAIYILNFLFKNGPPPNPMAAGDTNCDGTVSLSDAIYLLNFLFKEGNPPGC